MSWDAYLTDDRGHEEGSLSYTHNTPPAIYAVLALKVLIGMRDTVPEWPNMWTANG